ncbi:GNAT family N-acetyltransferase [Dictyobacter kobayashii]|uniref:N-acetyltransferase domain-containing protein n=1 Tax=Dictyobacter kobayashii TaxID=2014872 RepID=A0A402ABT5_9CHLR|nr:GNAT family N-acetyltransferase [Dictyobacter kobayashii]GCE16557.1 hypothetical protein KDK_03570 [Dictyobacter kobayashii]
MTAITLPTDLIIRAATRDDAQAIIDLYAKVELAETGQSDNTVSDVYELWDGEKLDLANNSCAIFTASGELIGYTGVANTGRGVLLDVHTQVHPAYAELPLADFLLQFADERTRVLLAADDKLPRRLYTWGFTQSNTALFIQHGFTIENSDYRMEVILETEPQQPQPLPGITVRPFIPGKEERAVYDVIAEAFPDIDGKPYRPYEDWYEKVFEKTASFEPSMLYVAVAEDQIVGVTICRVYPDNGEGFIWQVGMRRAWRKRGIANQLLRTALTTYYQRGMKRIMLDVDANNATGAHQLYASIGMHKQSQVDSLVKTF